VLPAVIAHLPADRKRLRPVEMAGHLRLTLRQYQALEAGERPPSWETWDRICKLFGWPQTLAGKPLVNTQPATD
jgi:DNA-binding XRE family transcriptional regulator